MSDVPRALRPWETVSVWEELENKEMHECFPSVRHADALGGAGDGPSSLQPVEPARRGTVFCTVFSLSPQDAGGLLCAKFAFSAHLSAAV